MDSPHYQLLDVVSNGIVIDIFSAEEALFLDDLIGHEAERINEATFGAFFGSLQMILVQRLILAVNRLFESPHRHYQLRSIPVALQILESHVDDLQIKQRSHLMKKFRSINAVKEDQTLESLSDSGAALLKRHDPIFFFFDSGRIEKQTIRIA